MNIPCKCNRCGRCTGDSEYQCRCCQDAITSPLRWKNYFTIIVTAIIFTLIVMFFMGCDNVSWTERDTRYKQEERLFKRLEALGHFDRVSCKEDCEQKEIAFTWQRVRILAELHALQRGEANDHH